MPPKATTTKKAAAPSKPTPTKVAAKPAAKPAAPTATKTATKVAAKPTTKPVAKTTTKVAAKPTTKTATKTPGKVVPKKAAAPVKKAKAEKKKAEEVTPFFQATPRRFGIGNIQPKQDLTRFVRWPRYVRMQRQKRVLLQRLKVPPAINQFSFTLDKKTAKDTFALLDKYKPETKVEKKKRLLAIAAAKAAGKNEQLPKPAATVKYGLNHITGLIEQKKAKLVIIAHDVEPIEIVVWLPALCRKMGVPYAIVKGKARLGKVVHKKTATALALTNVKKEDLQDFNNLSTVIKEGFNDRTDITRAWGGKKLGRKSMDAISKRAKAIAKEAKARTEAK